jgi:hypothetical protein
MKTHCIIAASILLASAAFASPGGGHSHDHGPAGQHTEVKIPATLPELWGAIQAGQAALVAALEKRDGGAAHAAAETMGAYANALPEKTAGLDEAKRKRVAGQAKNLARVYGEIHHAADDGAFDKALKEAARAAAVLKLIEPQVAPKS